MKPRTLAILRWAATVLFVAAGANHFINPAPYLGMMPAEIPVAWHSALNVISGAAEILGGLGLILPATRRLAAWGLIVLLVAVFPANVNMAVNELPLGTQAVPTWMLWARLPLQAVAIAWVYLFTRSVEK
ncbi:MAG: DoxX family membrane protein [Kofleriaceae bacterium]